MKLTFEQQVARAVTILGRKVNRAAVEDEVKALREPPLRRYRPGDFYSPKTTGEKRNAQLLRGALAKVKERLERCKLVPANQEWLTELDRLQAAADAVANYPLRTTGRSEEEKRRALRAAARLMKDAGLPLTKTRPNTERVTRGSKYIQLAAVLYGDTDADFFNYIKLTDKD